MKIPDQFSNSNPQHQQIACASSINVELLRQMIKKRKKKTKKYTELLQSKFNKIIFPKNPIVK